MFSIPVIGTAVVNSSYWVSRLLMSVDYPTKNFVIINNNGKQELNEELDCLSKIKHKFVEKVTICHMPANIGVAGAWNLIIKCYMNCPYWIISNDDIAFFPGFLNEMVSAADEDSNIGIIHGHKGDFDLGSWDLFLIKDFVIQQYGLFDENLYPAYTEDSDYIMRTLNKLKTIKGLKSNYFHGYGTKEDYYKEGSQTKKNDPTLEEKLNFCNEKNIEYLYEKWGKDWRICCPYQTPFNKNYPMGYTNYDLNFVRSKNLGF